MIEKEGLDYVIISTPPKSHYEIALNSMKRGVNVIIEKPAVLNMKEYDDLLNYAADHDLIFEVSYHWQNGAGYIKFVIVSDDGSFIDPEDTELLKNYVITGQSVSPNTELKYVFSTDSEGNEYDSLVQSQNIEEIEITVKPVGGN